MMASATEEHTHTYIYFRVPWLKLIFVVVIETVFMFVRSTFRLLMSVKKKRKKTKWLCVNKRLDENKFHFLLIFFDLNKKLIGMVGRRDKV